MALFLFRFYPVLLPLILYLLWLYLVRRRALKKGEPLPKFRDGSIFWLLISSLLIAALCFIAMGFSIFIGDYKGAYTEPAPKIYMEGKKLVPEQVKP